MTPVQYQNQQIVRRFFAALDDDTLDSIDELVAPGYRFHVSGNPDQTWEGHKQFQRSIRSSMPDMTHIIEQQLCTADRVATRITAEATHQGELLGIQPTGKRVAVTGIAMHRIEDGRIAEYWLMVDQLGLLVQLGALEIAA